jgi:excisionase family DNA binding protein
VTKPNAVTRDTISLLPDHLLDIEEAAAFLNCCRATVRREVARGRLRAQKVGQRWRFAPEDLLAYLDGEDPASTTERAAWDAYIRKVVAAAPPLRPEQVAALSALFDWQPGNGGAA